MKTRQELKSLTRAGGHTGPLERVILIFLALSLCLDAPAARAFNEVDTWTKDLGQHLFHGFKSLYGIPLPLTLFEIISYGLLALVWIRYAPYRSRFGKIVTLSAALVPLAALWAFFSAFIRGQSLSLAATQFHFIPLLAVWLVLGFYMGLRPSNASRIFKIIFFSTLFKSILGLWVFIVFYEMDMGNREFLIDHPTSIYLVIGMVYAAWQLLRKEVGFGQKLCFTLAFLLIASAYILNDRRASYAGVLASLVLLPLILPSHIRQNVTKLYVWSLPLGGVLLAVMAVLASNPYSFSGGIKSEILATDTLNYRNIENFNLLSGVALNPIVGIGFGTPYPQVIPLPDISSTFSMATLIPHNSLYYLWSYAGPFGIASFATLAWMSLLLITRVGQGARNSGELFAAIVAFFIVGQWIMFVFFDTGLLESRSHLVFGLLIGGLYPQYAAYIKDHSNETLAKMSRPSL